MKKQLKLPLICLSLVMLLICSSYILREKKKEGPKNIILLIGDGMGLSQISYGIISAKNRMHFERFQHIGLIKTSATDNKITDSAAGATAFACGKKTYNGAIGVDEKKKPLKTILELAEERHLATGLIATSSITHATPAAFIAHQPNREMHKEIARDFLRTDIDVFIGGGLEYFMGRENGKTYAEMLKDKGYCLVTERSELNKPRCDKLAALLSYKHMPKMEDGRGDFLSDAWKTASGILSKNENGFFLMIEGSQIDWGGHDNNAAYVLKELEDFDAVLGKVLDFAEKDGNTLVIVTADHETGGFSLSGNEDKYVDVLPSFNTTSHTATMVPVFAYGPGAEAFSGIYENSELFHKMKKAFGF